MQENINHTFKNDNFIRYGGLSATPHNVHYRHRKDYFHTPPTKKGIFCFLDGYVEPYLYLWKMSDDKGKIKKESHLKKREFKYKGKVWTHVKIQDKDVKYYREKGSWYETDTDSLRIIFKKYGKDADIQHEVYIEKKCIGGI